jgi:PAS domain S-box-containing protein
VWVLTNKVPLRDRSGKIVGTMGVSHDISDRKRSEDALREAERKYHGIVDEAIVGIFQLSLNGGILSINPSMAATSGYASTEDMLAGLKGSWKKLFLDPKRCDECFSLLAQHGRVTDFEFQAVRKDDKAIWLSISAHTIYEDSVAVRYEGMSEDVTERKLMRNQLLQSQKLESVGQLAAGIAHEINTPTQYIGDNVHFLKDAFQGLTEAFGVYNQLMASAGDAGLSRAAVGQLNAAIERFDVGYFLEEAPKALDQALEGIARVSTLVKAMKEFSHPGTKQKVPLDLNHAIQSTITVARNEWKYVAHLETDFDPELPLVPCLPDEFNQVILNLLVNASHAIGDAQGDSTGGLGEIRVQTRNLEK